MSVYLERAPEKLITKIYMATKERIIYGRAEIRNFECWIRYLTNERSGMANTSLWQKFLDSTPSKLLAKAWKKTKV